MVEVPTKLSSKQKELLKEFDCLSKDECTPISKGFFEKVRELFGEKEKK
jgi:molecular chaperone DnaJ